MPPQDPNQATNNDSPQPSGQTPVPVPISSTANPRFTGSDTSLTRPHVSSGTRSKAVLIISVVVVLLILGAVLALAGGKSDDSNTSKSSTPATPAYQSETTKKKPAASLTKTPLTQTVTTDLGYKVDASELVRNFPAKSPDDGTETVLVKVTITEVSSQYTGSSPYGSDFRLVVDGQEKKHSLIVSDREAADAGYPALPAEAAEKDKPTSGYLIFDVPTDSKPLTLRYIQQARKVLSLGSSQTLPAKNYDVALQ